MSLLTLLEKRTIVDKRTLTAILLAAIILLGAALRLLDLGAESYWLDEVKMLEVAGGGWDVIVRQTQNGRPPVFVVAAHYWMQLFGTGEAATRLLPAISGTVALLFMYVAGRELFDEEVVLIATFLMAISEFQIAQSQNFRYYSVFLVFTLISFFSWIRALRTGQSGYFVLYVLSTLAMFYSHTHGIFIIAAQGLYFVLQALRYRPVWLKWLASQVLILLGLLPGLSIAFGGAVEGTSNVFQWIPDPHWWQPVLTFMRFVFPGRHYPALITVAGALSFAVIAFGLFVAWKGKATWLSSLRELVPAVRGLLEKRSELLIVGCWLTIPIILPLLLSGILGPMYLDRYVIGTSPALYLLIALVIVTLRKVVHPIIPLGILAILITPGLYEYYVIPTKEQWREAAAYLHQQAQPNDRFIFAPGENGAIEESLQWYYRAPTPGCALEVGIHDAAAITAMLPDCIAGTGRVWLVIRGAPARVKPFEDYFLAHPLSHMNLVDHQKFKDVDLYSFNVIQPKTSTNVHAEPSPAFMSTE